MTRAGFPHSDIPGSEPACGFPRLIAACHVLHRLPTPRHPPHALSSLATKGLTLKFSALPFIRYRLIVKDRSRSYTFRSVAITAGRRPMRTASTKRVASTVLGTMLGHSQVVWRIPGSNRWPPACKAGALPTELIPHTSQTCVQSASQSANGPR